MSDETGRACHFCGGPILDSERAIEARTRNAWAHFECWYDGTPSERDPVTWSEAAARAGGRMSDERRWTMGTDQLRGPQLGRDEVVEVVEVTALARVERERDALRAQVEALRDEVQRIKTLRYSDFMEHDAQVEALTGELDLQRSRVSVLLRRVSPSEGTMAFVEARESWAAARDAAAGDNKEAQ